MHPIVHSSTVDSSGDMETASVAISTGVGQGGVVHVHSALSPNHKEEQNNAVCSNTDGPRDCHRVKYGGQRQISYNIAYVWNIKRKRAQTNLFTKQSRVADVENKHG